MDSNHGHVQNRVDGISNYVVWNDRIHIVFEEAIVWDIVRQVVVPPIATNELVEFTKNNAKAKRILMDNLKDHVVPQVRGNTCISDVDSANHSLSEY